MRRPTVLNTLCLKKLTGGAGQVSLKVRRRRKFNARTVPSPRSFSRLSGGRECGRTGEAHSSRRWQGPRTVGSGSGSGELTPFSALLGRMDVRRCRPRRHRPSQQCWEVLPTSCCAGGRVFWSFVTRVRTHSRVKKIDRAGGPAARFVGRALTEPAGSAGGTSVGWRANGDPASVGDDPQSGRTSHFLHPSGANGGDDYWARGRSILYTQLCWVGVEAHSRCWKGLEGRGAQISTSQRGEEAKVSGAEFPTDNGRRGGLVCKFARWRTGGWAR